MVVMALDHARDFLGLKAFNATDLTKTTLSYFFTRWVTHFCAPGFMLLAGSAAFLMQRSKPELSRFLLTRGLWLVFAELTIINFAWTFSFARPGLMVIWALGWSMVLLAALVWLPAPALAAVSLGTILLHNIFDGLQAGPLLDASGGLVGSAGDWALSVLHQKNSPLGFLVIFGRVPFFFYLLHLLLLHSMAVGLGVAQGFEWAQFISPFWKFPKAYGLSLGWVYVAWASAVLVLYFPSRWFAGLKTRRRDWWLSYL